MEYNCAERHQLIERLRKRLYIVIIIMNFSVQNIEKIIYFLLRICYD